MYLRIIPFAAILLFISSIKTFAYKTWEVIELSFQSDKAYENPYQMTGMDKRTDLLRLEIEGIDGACKGMKYNLSGFWDGGKTFKVRFAAPATGTWRYTSSSSDNGLTGKKGEFAVTGQSEKDLAQNPLLHGFIRVAQKGPNAGHYFEYADGTPFLWIGDTWWNWAKSEIPFFRFKALVDDRSAKGFTVAQLFVPGNGWGKSSYILTNDFTALDIVHMQAIDRMIAYANSKGIVVWVHAWWSRENMDKTIGEEKIIRWWRYLVNRLGAYNVIWSLAGEYNMYDYGGLGLEFWKKLGAMVKQEDPFGHITGTHVTPPNWSGGAQAPQWSTGDVMNSEPWLDYNQSQLGHGKYANEMAPMVIAQNYARHPVKPIVITEPWYEFREGNAPALDIRFAAWSALLSGAAGHTYGGGHAWLGNVPESPANVKEWPVENDPAFETYNYPGAVSMGVLAKVFSTIDWWTMVPMPQAVTDYPQPLCLAQPGKEYLVYLRYGGSFSIDLQDITSTSSFNVTWIDPSNGHRIPATQQVAGGKKTLLYSPSVYPDSIEYKDWVGFLKLAE